MKKIFLFILVVSFTSFFNAQVFARCQFWGPPINQYRCLPDSPGQGGQEGTGGGSGEQRQSGGGITQLDLTISCSASGSAVDWINTVSLDCGDGNRYDALAVQKDEVTLGAYFRQVPPNRNCSVSASSGFDSKDVGTVSTSGSARQTLRGVCAW